MALWAGSPLSGISGRIEGGRIRGRKLDAFVYAVDSEVEQAQVRLIAPADARILFHYWKMGNYILYHQNLQGRGKQNHQATGAGNPVQYKNKLTAEFCFHLTQNFEQCEE